MRILLAGATGAVGRPLVRQLAAAGHHVIALTRAADKTAALSAAGAEAIVCDVYDRDHLIAVARDGSPDAVIHQLTDLPQAMDPGKLGGIYERNNRVRREGTRNLLDAAAAAGAQRFVVQSMGTWYEPAGGAIKAETEALWLNAPEPLGTAVRTVDEMERAVLREAGIGVVLRYGAFYGPGTWYAADGEIARRMRSRGFPIIGRGEGVTSFVHIDDAASAAVAALAAAASAVYNVADDEPAPASLWMPAYAEAIGAPKPFSVPAFAARLALGSALTEWLTTLRGASNTKMTRECGWRPRFPSWRDGFRTLHTR
jgi:nucleoside-diphosphate-sugar epimerase